MLRYAITDGTASGFVNTAQIFRMTEQVRRWAEQGIDFVQLREKSLEPGALLMFAEAAMRVLDEMQSRTKLLINGRSDIAIAARANGVHLTSHADELTPEQVRSLFAHAGLSAPVVSISCHTVEEVGRARDSRADLILFGPVFEKRVDGALVISGVGLQALEAACRLAQQIPVLALGGVSNENADACLAAGAAGIAGIRTFS